MDTKQEATSESEISDVRMTPELKAEWVAALRSGEYKQYKNGYMAPDRHCCLAVLAEVSGLLNPFVLDGEKPGSVPTSLLIDLNDMEDSTFLTVADWIDANVVPA